VHPYGQPGRSKRLAEQPVEREQQIQQQRALRRVDLLNRPVASRHQQELNAADPFIQVAAGTAEAHEPHERGDDQNGAEHDRFDWPGRRVDAGTKDRNRERSRLHQGRTISKEAPPPVPLPSAEERGSPTSWLPSPSQWGGVGGGALCSMPNVMAGPGPWSAEDR